MRGGQGPLRICGLSMHCPHALTIKRNVARWHKKTTCMATVGRVVRVAVVGVGVRTTTRERGRSTDARRSAPPACADRTGELIARGEPAGRFNTLRGPQAGRAIWCLQLAAASVQRATGGEQGG